MPIKQVTGTSIYHMVPEKGTKKKKQDSGPPPHEIYPEIRAAGPEICERLAVGRSGDETENRFQTAFIGKTGQLLDAYLYCAGISREGVRVTNVYPWWTGPGNPDPKQEWIEQHQGKLNQELKQTGAIYVLTLGRMATRWFLGNVNMETVHGIPHEIDSRPEWGKRRKLVVVPAFDPAGGFHVPEIAAKSATDIIKWGMVVRGKAKPLDRVDRIKPEYRLLEPRLKLLINRAAVDTEGTVRKPWGLSYSTRPGEGVVVLRKDCKQVRFLGKVVFHNSLYDLGVLRELGVPEIQSFTDTMVMAYLLQIEPQGLKELAYRYCGVKMKSFDDLVRPYFNAAAMEYLAKVSKQDWGQAKAEVVIDSKTGEEKLYKPQPLNKRIVGILNSYEKEKAKQGDEVEDEKAKFNFHTRWGQISEPLRRPAEAMLGVFPHNKDVELVPLDEAIPYSARDADVTGRVEDKLFPMIVEMGLERALESDLAIIPMIDRMQYIGMHVDLAKVSALEEQLRRNKFNAAAKLEEVVGRKVNAASGNQVAEVIGGGLIPRDQIRLTRTKTRIATDEKTLRAIQLDLEAKIENALSKNEVIPPQWWDGLDIVDSVSGYRTSQKFLSTFLSPLHRLVDARSRIHPNLRITRVVSGRLASSNPNLLAYPVRTKIGKAIRACFTAELGWRLLTCDLSQIELRVMAHESRDRQMMKAFTDDIDLHYLTASIMFGIPLDQVTKEQRYVAKTLNFAIMYGISPYALLQQLILAGITRYTQDDCAQFITEWFKIYNGVRDYLKGCIRYAERHGFVRGMSGRLRYLPNIHVEDPFLRAEAERHSGNHPIQEGAQYICKKGMKRIWDWRKTLAQPTSIEPLLQIHDEVVFQVHEKKADEYGKRIQGLMTMDKLRVPLAANYSSAESWGALDK